MARVRPETRPTRRPIRGWRKIAVATWHHPNDPQIYGDLEIDATALLAYLDEVREATGLKVTVTHLVGRAVAHALGEHPDLNGRIHRGRFVERDGADVFFIVSAEQGSELTGVKVVGAQDKSLVAIAEELGERTRRIHAGQDEDVGRTKTMLERVPPRVLRLALRAAAWLTVDLDLHLPALGLPRQTFGSALVSSVGMFGIRHAYAPLSPYYRVPFLVLVGEVTKRPVVEDDEIVVRPMVTITATLDHRYLDGFHAARLARSLEAYLADPAAAEPPLPGGDAAVQDEDAQTGATR